MDTLSLEAPIESTAPAVCIHCNTRFKPAPSRTLFCCSGCEFVYGLIRDQGLEKFYQFRDGPVAPVNALVFQKRDYRWLAELLDTRGSAEVAELRLELQGISCIACAWLIESIFLKKPGALAIEVDAVRGEVCLRWKAGQCDIIGFASQIQQFGYLLGPLQSAAPHRRTSGFIKRMGVCGAFAMNAMLFSIPRYLGMDESFPLYAWFDRLAFAFGSLSFFVGGSFFIRRAFEGALNRVCQIDLPIALGLIAAYLGSVFAWLQHQMHFAYFDFVSTFTFLMLVGRWTQQTALERNRNRLLRSQSSVPPVQIEGKASDAIELKPGVHYTIHPGQLIPVRSKLLSDCAVLGLEWINGESEPRVATIGQLLPAGAIHRSSQPLGLEALESWSSSLLAPLLAASPRPALHQNLSQKFIARYIIAVVGTAVLGALVWLMTGATLLVALQILIAVLVVSCPCASGVALPFLDELAIAALRSGGTFVRESSLWQRLLRVRKIVFDKTGTLTLEAMALVDPGVMASLSMSEKERLLSMVADSLHPVACCLRELLMSEGVGGGGPIEAPVEVVGQGIEYKVGNEVWRLGRPGWSGVESNTADCVFSRNGRELAAFRFTEQIRAGATAEIAALRSRGYEVYIISGDRREKVETMADHLQIPRGNCRAELTPGEKAEWVRANDTRDTLMIGDGANDSLAFNESFCTGTPAIDRGLLERKSDFYFLGRGLHAIRQLIEVAHARRCGIRGILLFTITYNIVAVVAAILGWIGPVAAAVAMPVSSLISLGIAIGAARGFRLTETVRENRR